MPRIGRTIDSYNARYSVEKRTTMAFDGANFEENPMKWDRERKSQRGRLCKRVVLVCGRQWLLCCRSRRQDNSVFLLLLCCCCCCCVVCVST